MKYLSNKTVTFKNGKTMKISYDNYKTIVKNLGNGCSKFQMFTHDSEIEKDFIINLEEVVCIG